jgi:hypothetical protein
MTLTVEPPPVEDLDAGVIREARARERRQRRGVAAAIAAAAGIIALALSIAGGGRAGNAAGRAALPGQTPLTVKANGLTNAACVWHPTLSGTPDKALLSILGVLRRAPGPTDTDPAIKLRGLGGAATGFELYSNYIRFARSFDGGPTYLLIVRNNGCARFGDGRAGDGVWISRPGVHELGGSQVTTTKALETGQWLWLGGPAIKGLATTSETVSLLVPDVVASVSIRYPTEAVEPAYHRHPGPIVPALTINAKPVNNLVMFNVHHHSSAAMAPLTMTWRATDGHVIKTFHRL